MGPGGVPNPRLGFLGTGWIGRHRMEAMVRLDPAAMLGATTSLTIHLLGAVVAALAIIAIGDYFFQYRSWFQRQKMSLQEIKEEAARLDRSLSWVVQRAWKISRLEIKKLPSVNEVDGGDDDDEP